MTQVKSAQLTRDRVALRQRASHRSLAARRQEFVTQVRDMAVSDLSNVSKRLKGLHAELERKTGRKWTHYELAEAMKIAPRTFQSWENGEVENRDGKGYDKMARFYARKLGRKITRQWVLFGDEKPAQPAPDVLGALGGDAGVRKQLDRIEAKLDQLLADDPALDDDVTMEDAPEIDQLERDLSQGDDGGGELPDTGTQSV